MRNHPSARIIFSLATLAVSAVNAEAKTAATHAGVKTAAAHASKDPDYVTVENSLSNSDALLIGNSIAVQHITKEDFVKKVGDPEAAEFYTDVTDYFNKEMALVRAGLDHNHDKVVAVKTAADKVDTDSKKFTASATVNANVLEFEKPVKDNAPELDARAKFFMGFNAMLVQQGVLPSIQEATQEGNPNFIVTSINLNLKTSGIDPANLQNSVKAIGNDEFNIGVQMRDTLKVGTDKSPPGFRAKVTQDLKDASAARALIPQPSAIPSI